MILRLNFDAFAMLKINMLAIKNRIPDRKNGGNSVTDILFNKYVEPQITYMAKKAIIIKAFELN